MGSGAKQPALISQLHHYVVSEFGQVAYLVPHFLIYKVRMKWYLQQG